MQAKPGDVLGGKYVLDERIGEGGMGIVFLAHQPALARSVAIKMLRPELAGDREVARRFRDEAVAASRVRHPRSLHVIDCAVLPDGTPYIVMEHVRGRALGRVIAEEEIPLPRAIELTLQILSAVAAAHDAGVVHADIKSDNFLVEHVDGADHVTMIDFGLARLVGERGADERGAGERVVSGTPEYMAPEVIQGAPPGVASDLYGVGVILYELLTGSAPFRGGASAEVMTRHLEDVVVPPSLRACDRDVPATIDAIVLRALAKEPGERFASADELARALRATLPFRRVPAPRTTRPRDAATPDSPTRTCVVSGPRRRFARGSDCNAVAATAETTQLRHAIGNAMVHGDVPEIASGYLALAAKLVTQQQWQAAAYELQEGIAVLSAADSCDALGQLSVALAAIYDESGDRTSARRAGSGADRCATLASAPHR